MRKVKYSHKVIAFFLAINILQGVLPYNLLYASNNGPNAPEASGFESANATDMVNLSSGDMSYVLPVMDVGGLPISLSYHGGIPLDLESTWTGLGWNLNTGAINRNLNATPDDWKGGNSLDFIRYVDSETYTSVNFGVGIYKCAEVGVGASMGSNKGLTGSVYASLSFGGYYGASASMDTNGNYGLGIGAQTGKNGADGFGGGLQISGNVNGGKTSIGVSAGVRASGMTIGVGANLDGSGMSASLGYGTGEGQNRQSGGASLSTSSFSVGDWDVSSHGWYIPIVIPGFSFGFGQQKVTFSLKKAYYKVGYGILYSNYNSSSPSNDAIESDNSVDSYFYDYQNRFRYMDCYDESIPVTEKQFIGDYDTEREKLNFTFAGYDSYDVNAAGIAGVMSPRIFQNSTLTGLGYIGPDPHSDDQGKLRVYGHNSTPTTKQLGATTAANNINFYFNGQFTHNAAINPVTLNNTNSTSPSFNTLASFMSGTSTINARQHQGNYVEVFTNRQIKNGQALGLLSPLNPNSNGLSLEPLNRDSPEYKDEGIGGYRITAPDGKVYHFSQPVYHFEEVDRNILKDNTEDNVSEKRQYSSYATHWVLTAITGPDYIDTNQNNIADAEDYGYWVRMDYGKWSDGYVWRTPTDKNLMDYHTNIESNVKDTDFGNYQFGRKQLYYLDRVVSATHTAYFVKDLRYDSAGCDLNYHYNPLTRLSNDGSGNGTANQCIYPYENFTYKRQMQLMLKKIVLVKNTDAMVSKGDKDAPLRLNNENISDYVPSEQLDFYAGGPQQINPYTTAIIPSGGFYNEYGKPTVILNNESGVYDIKDFEDFDYNRAAKVVDFDYDYNLAVKDPTNINNLDPTKSKGSPGTIICSKNPNAGKLCLKSVRFLGRNNFDYMPPYRFEYKGHYDGPTSNYKAYPPNAIAQRIVTTFISGSPNPQSQFGQNYLHHTIPTVSSTIAETPITNIRAKDEWGFYKEDPAAWTMTKIITPTGANIEFEHEEDDFKVEAFARKFWNSDLQFKISDLPNGNLQLEIKNEEGMLSAGVDFTKHFALNTRAFIDLWVCRNDRHDLGHIDINENNICMVTSVTTNNVVLQLNRVMGQPIVLLGNTYYIGGTLWGDHLNLVKGDFFISTEHCNGSHVFDPQSRGECPDGDNTFGNGSDHWTISYRLLANKVPMDETGGGLRVKSITLKDENNNRYKTRYYYNEPGSAREKTDPSYVSSGITSFSPVKGTKFVPYQSQLPSPGVMYEYVSMVPQDAYGNSLGEIRYKFYTLKPVLDIFNENIEMKDDDGTIIFKATVNDHSTNPFQYIDHYEPNPFDPNQQMPVYKTDYYYNVTKKIRAKSIKVDVNTSLVGQFRSVEEFNNEGQLMSKSEKKYLSGYNLKTLAASTNSDHIDRGSIAESFQSMKSIYTANSDDENVTLKNRLLSVSTKEEYPSVLQSVITTGVHGKSTQIYSKTDPETGGFLVVESEKADGSLNRVERVPAYKKYSALGSKATNPANKNMLTQEAMNITSVLKNNSWIATSANITTWDNEWTYRDNFGNEMTPIQDFEKIWRKSKSFVLNKPLSISNSIAVGSYFGGLSNTLLNFNWTTNSPINDYWKKVSEVTRYNHYSSPIETKDINNNFVSSKMADNDNKVIVSGNARYTEMYYSGAEYIAGGNVFEGEVLGADFRTKDVAHTGQYSVKTDGINSKVFQVSTRSGNSDYYVNPDSYNGPLRPGKYKVSFWGLNTDRAIKATQLIFNDQEVTLAESQAAGCWTLFNYYIDVPENSDIDIYVKNSTLSEDKHFYYDDFRMHPISTSINSYVYDHATDELVTILDANNLGKTFKYDNAGRMVASYVETVNSSGYYGGFKITSQFKQKYKGTTVDIQTYPLVINNCYANDILKLEAKIEPECLNTYETTFKVATSGGSGNFTYQYQNMKDYRTKEYSNFFVGDSIQSIPYVIRSCEDGKSFDKVWNFNVRITDNVSGKDYDENYNYETKGCQFDINRQTDLEVNRCNNNCSSGNYGFKIYPINKDSYTSYKYEYAYYNPELNLDQQNYINISNNDGSFCPVFAKVIGGNCESGFREYVHLVYKVTNLTRNESLGIVHAIILGDCLNMDSENIELKIKDPLAEKYVKPGYIVKLNEKGELIEIVPIQKVVN